MRKLRSNFNSFETWPRCPPTLSMAPASGYVPRLVLTDTVLVWEGPYHDWCDLTYSLTNQGLFYKNIPFGRSRLRCYGEQSYVCLPMVWAWDCSSPASPSTVPGFDPRHLATGTQKTKNPKLWTTEISSAMDPVNLIDVIRWVYFASPPYFAVFRWLGIVSIVTRLSVPSQTNKRLSRP